MAITFNDTRARRKQDSAQELIRAFGPFGMLMQDALEFLKTSMMAQEVNFDPVGIVTGNLRRAYSTAGLYERLPYTIRLTPNLSVAPYVPEVSQRIQKRFGKTFVQLTLDRQSALMDDCIRREVLRAVAIISAGGRYKYENPFPPIAFTGVAG